MKIVFSKEEIFSFLREGKKTSEIANIYNVDIQQIRRFLREIELPNDIYIRHRPQKIELTQNEIDVLIGGILGDSWIGYTKFAKNVSGSFTHKIEHEEYVQFKYNYLKRLCTKPVIHNKFDNRNNRNYQQVFCKIGTNPILNSIQKEFYKNKRKTISSYYVNKLSPLGIAIWYMDDGCKTSHGYSIATNCFNLEELEILQTLLLKFDINSSLIKNKDSHIIYIPKESKNKFTKLIKDFIPNCMKYKVHELSS